MQDACHLFSAISDGCLVECSGGRTGFIGATGGTAAGARDVRRRGVVASPGEELLHGKRDAGKHFTRILCTAGIIAAFLGGDGVVKGGNQQLHIPLQADDGELSQCDIQPAALSGEDQFIVEQVTDSSRELI